MPGVVGDPTSPAAPAQDRLDISRLTMSPDYLQLLAGGTSPLSMASGPGVGYAGDPSLGSVLPFPDFPQSGSDFGDISPASLAAQNLSSANYDVGLDNHSFASGAFSQSPASLSFPSLSDGRESFDRDVYGRAFDPAASETALGGYAFPISSVAGPDYGSDVARSMADAIDSAAGAIGDALIGRAEAKSFPDYKLPALDPKAVDSAIDRASRETGVDRNLLKYMADKESTYGKYLQPKRHGEVMSSGVGLYHTLRQTWLGEIHNHGKEIGLGKIASHIKATRKDGNLFWTTGDPATDDKILGYRADPYLSALITAASRRAFAQRVTKETGQNATTGQMYAGHWLNDDKAMRAIIEARRRPNTLAKDVFPDVSSQLINRANFFKPDGRPRSIKDFMDNLDIIMNAHR